jgi:hypothetical protein
VIRLKVLILAMDGLEYNLVIKWNLKGLIQRYYGIHAVVKSPRYGKAHTPSSWVSFITGLPPEEHGVDDWWSWGRILDWLRTHPPLVWVKGKRLLLAKLGIKLRPRIAGRDMVRAETIFDVIQPSVALNVPGWNEPTEPHVEYEEAARRGVRDLIAKVWEWHERRKRQLFEALADPGRWRLLMAWFDLADLIGHACMVKCRLELRKAYVELDRLARQVAERIPSNTALLIASDHGMTVSTDGVTGDHSDHGFWSLNVEPPFYPRSILDFKSLIIDLARDASGGGA